MRANVDAHVLPSESRLSAIRCENPAEEMVKEKWRLLPDEDSHGKRPLPLRSTHVRLGRLVGRIVFSRINRMALRSTRRGYAS